MSSLFESRDAFADFRSHTSALRWEERPLLEAPLVTIAIPTFKRIDTLQEAIESAAAQRTDLAYEILIVDNDPDSSKWTGLLDGLSPQAKRRVRYYVNSSNLGMFGNWNRCIELARGEWVTILNDDDLLRPEFLHRCFALIRRRPETDGIVCGKVVRDRRSKRGAAPAARPADAADRVVWRVAELVRKRQFRRGFARLEVRRLFFGNDIGNGAGFLFRKEAALQLGGYDPGEWPVSDFFFYLRFAKSRNLYRIRENLAEVGIGDNESMERETLLGFITKVQEAREELAGREVPAAWLKLSPQLVANHLHAARINWDSDIPAEEVEARVGFAIPAPSEKREILARLRRRAL
jgi:glycosyltransferase involved in cell wall biosynthesis